MNLSTGREFFNELLEALDESDFRIQVIGKSVHHRRELTFELGLRLHFWFCFRATTNEFKTTATLGSRFGWALR